MKLKLPLTLLAFVLINNIALSQIDLPIDSVTNLLCKKWEVSYSLLDDVKIGRMPNAPNLIYEFKKDKTFILKEENSKEKPIKGTWSYNQKGKNIKLSGTPTSIIVSLKSGELTIITKMEKGKGPDDLPEIKTVYKIKAD